MKNTADYAPFRKGMSHGEKSDTIGTGNYWVKYMQNGEWVDKHEFKADNEDDAGDIALSLCPVEKDQCGIWKYVHECSTHRGYEIEVPNGSIVLFHVL